MNRTAHTPGPWIDDNERDHYARRVIRHNGVVVATVSEPTAGLSVDEVTANGPVLAAAPEMLEALYGMLEWARRVTQANPGPEIATAIAAIAKAEGHSA
jgi:hypothetical protein